MYFARLFTRFVTGEGHCRLNNRSLQPCLFAHLMGFIPIITIDIVLFNMSCFSVDDLLLTGAKLGCGEGGCGACTVLVSRSRPWQEGIEHKSINACLCPLYSIIGCHVITVEGIGSTKSGLHPVQKRIAKAHGSQCGFCTPGFVMSMYALLRSKEGSLITEEEIEENLAGNLCRCTGYRPILDAFRPFAAMYTNGSVESGMNESTRGTSDSPVCPTTGRPCDCKQGKSAGHCTPCQDVIGELITPPEVIRNQPKDLCVMGGAVTWYRPVTLQSLLDLKNRIPDAKIVAGNTEIGIEVKFKHARYPNLISIGWIKELADVDIRKGDCVIFGGGVSLSTLMKTCRSMVEIQEMHQSHSFKAIAEQLKWFAGPSIRNWGTIGGNVVTASPISDLNPLWIVTRSEFRVASQTRGFRDIPATEFFLGYRKVALEPDEILISVRVPCTRKFEYVKEFKQAQRRDDDIAIVNCGVRVSFEFVPNDDAWVIKDSCIAYGGVAPVSISARATSLYLQGKTMTNKVLQEALDIVQKEVVIGDDAPGGRVPFRRSLVLSFLIKGLVHASACLQNDTKDLSNAYVSSLKGQYALNCAEEFVRPPCRGIQYFSETGSCDIVGTPIQHASAELQASGEAKYVDDIPKSVGTLHAALIVSEKPHAVIKAINVSKAISMAGVEGIHFAEDIPGSNSIGPVIQDEEIFATSLVTCVGQPIGVVTAKSRTEALAAVQAIEIEYDELEPILTIQDAINHNSTHADYAKEIHRGAVDEAFADTTLTIVQGTVRMGGQEHFYLEPNAHYVIPTESGEIVSYSSTQCPQKHQQYISSCLGIPSNKVVVKTKRIGGGFGGKETRAAFLNTIAAIPAYILNKPVSLVIDRDVDMSITGHRHPFMATYKAACDGDGNLRAIDVHLYNNAGNSLDLSASVMDRALLSIDSVYHIPNVRVQGTVCKTNLPSNTAFRGFGAPQAMMVIESIIENLSRRTGIPTTVLTEKNMYRDGDSTHYGQVIHHCQAQRCWKEALESAGGLDARQRVIEAFNSSYSHRKRGLAVVPTKFGISFTLKFLNQAGALIHIYQSDGSVLVSHGGVEMGQGLHTKICQIVAQALGIPLETVHINETATDKIPNATPTAASASSDLYGAAAADACAQLNARLQPYRIEHPDASFVEIVKRAYLDRVDLSAHGFYKTPDITDFPGGTMPFNYFTYGTAVTEVELDTLTGNWHTIRSDIVMDVGKSLNPAIDIGQIEGAFVQGMGWSCLEEVVWGDNAHPWIRKKGSLFSCGPGTYKIPTANDIPIDFRVQLLRDAPCERTPLVHSSKAVGEPPFFLGTSVFWALKNAIYASRKDSGMLGWFQLDLPCTPERLRMACTMASSTAAAAAAAEKDLPALSC